MQIKKKLSVIWEGYGRKPSAFSKELFHSVPVGSEENQGKSQPR
jgi:hypothetical protein